MSNVLLVRPGHPHVHAVSFGEQSFPLGIAFLIACLRERGHTVQFVDRYVDQAAAHPADIVRDQPVDVVGIYACSITFGNVLRILERLQILRERRIWRGKIVVGGPHAALRPDAFPEYVDHVVVGEGERAIVDIVEGSCRERIVRYPRIRDLDSLPFPAYDMLLSIPYLVRFAMLDRQPMANMSTSRGCPFRCRFCSVHSVWGSSTTSFSAERVASDFARLATEHSIAAIYFREDNFLLDKRRLEEICERLARWRGRVVWGAEASVRDLQDEEIFRLLRAAGCVHLFLGIESLCQRVLDLMDKRITLGQIKRTLELCSRYEIAPFGSFIIGYPGETEQEMRETIRGASRLFPPRMYCLNAFQGFPRSPIYEEVVAAGDHDHIDPVSGFFYYRDHDRLMELGLQGPVPIARRSPHRFIGLADNVNNRRHSLDELLVPPEGTLTLAADQQTGLRYDGLLALGRQLEGSTHKAIYLNNMLHRVALEDLLELIRILRGSLAAGGSLLGITRDRGCAPLAEALVHNFPAEHVYSWAELEEHFESIRRLEPTPPGMLAFEQRW